MKDKVDPQETKKHYRRTNKVASTGKAKGSTVLHFSCNYCEKSFQGPSSGTILKHLRAKHAKKCPDLLKKEHGNAPPPRDILDKKKLDHPFDADIFIDKLLTWIIKSNHPLSIVESTEFGELIEYLKKDIILDSRRTIGSRLQELYHRRKDFSSGTDLGSPDSCSSPEETSEMIQYLKFNLDN